MRVKTRKTRRLREDSALRPPDPPDGYYGMVARFLLTVAAVAAVAIALSEYLSWRAIDRVDAANSLQDTLDRQPWGGLAARELTRVLQTRWRIDPGGAEEAMLRQLSRYPNDPYAWLLLSSMARHEGDSHEKLMAHLSAAVGSEPGNAMVHWQAAQLALATEDRELAEHHLRLWLEGRSRFTSRVLFIARRWIDDPGERLDRVLPEGQAYLESAMRHANRQRDVALAHAVWERLEQPREPSERVVSDYLATAMRDDDRRQVMAVWQRLDPAYEPGAIPVGHFHLPLESLPAFNWRTRMPDGARLTRETIDSPPWHKPGENNEPAHALRLEFDGSENPRFRHLRVSFPVPEAGKYQLTGWWRGGGLTTRSLPWIRAQAHETGGRKDLELPSSHFDWEPFTLELEIDQPDDTVSIRVMRSRTDAFDRYIEGSLWLAALELRRLTVPEPLPLEIDAGDGHDTLTSNLPSPRP